MHGAKMSMNNDGELKLEKRKKNALIYTKRLMNNTFGIDMKKQSALSLVTGHFKFYDVKVHPWTIDFAAADINFDHHMNNSNPLDLEEIFDEHAKKVRELENICSSSSSLTFLACSSNISSRSKGFELFI